MKKAAGRLGRRYAVADVVDGCFFTFSTLAGGWLAFLLLRDGVRGGWTSLLLVVFWVFFTYLALPRLHRLLTRVYVPGYFLGRTRTSDGLLGDPVNLAFQASEAQLHRAFEKSGWTRAEGLGVRTGWRIVTATLGRRSYPGAPVSPLHLFDRQQDFAYQREVAGSPAQRHHVRLWRCPEGWLLPGGFAVEWLAAATYDRRVGLSLFTLQITHRIEEDTDIERDFVVDSLGGAVSEVTVSRIKNFSTGYHSRNGGGDRIITDGDLPVLDLGAVPAPPLATATDSRSTRPAQTAFGAGLALLRSVSYLLIAVLFAVQPEAVRQYADAAPVDATEVRTAGIVIFAVAAAVDIGLALAVLAGRNWARLLLMSACSVTALTAFRSTIGAGSEPLGLASLPTVGGSILVLLSLSSRRARDFATSRRARAADAVSVG